MVNDAARLAGVQAGLRYADAKARLPGLLTDDIDRAADAAALRALGDWLVRFSPRVALDGEDGLMLETSGCAHLFGGEAMMLEALRVRMVQAGYTARLAFASTPGAAHALARGGAGQGPWILQEGDERVGLAALPVKTLRLSDDASTLLRRFGLTRIGQLYGIDRTALTRRFASRAAADAVCLRLDQALGLRSEPFAPLKEAPEHVAHLPCPEPLGHGDGVIDGLRQLSEALGAELARFGQGARHFSFTALKADGSASQVSVTAARAARDPAHIQRLFRDKLERIDPGFGIDHLILEASRLAPMQVSAIGLPGGLAGDDEDEAQLAALADRLNAKLGQGSAQVSHPHASYLPERAETLEAYAGALPAISSAPQSGPRPVRMFARPERVDVLAEVPDGPPLRFVWRRVARRVVRADGPERIAPEWWTHVAGEALPRTRDYFRVEDEAGRRYWIFREGLYEDGRGGPPDWHVHGLFA